MNIQIKSSSELDFESLSYQRSPAAIQAEKKGLKSKGFGRYESDKGEKWHTDKGKLVKTEEKANVDEDINELSGGKADDVEPETEDADTEEGEDEESEPEEEEEEGEDEEPELETEDEESEPEIPPPEHHLHLEERKTSSTRYCWPRTS